MGGEVTTAAIIIAAKPAYDIQMTSPSLSVATCSVVTREDDRQIDPGQGLDAVPARDDDGDLRGREALARRAGEDPFRRRPPRPRRRRSPRTLRRSAPTGAPMPRSSADAIVYTVEPSYSFAASVAARSARARTGEIRVLKAGNDAQPARCSLRTPTPPRTRARQPPCRRRSSCSVGPPGRDRAAAARTRRYPGRGHCLLRRGYRPPCPPTPVTHARGLVLTTLGGEGGGASRR